MSDHSPDLRSRSAQHEADLPEAHPAGTATASARALRHDPVRPVAPATPGAASTTPHLLLEDVKLTYGEHTVVERFTLALAAGSIGCLLGASGCGKTTVLRAIAGFMPLQAGRIELAGRTISLPGRQEAPETRRIGMVFQDFALFPHLSVAQNVAFGLEAGPARLGRSARRSRVADMLDLVGLTALSERLPHELSGGQQQRVALARALAPEPGLLLLDEPFSSLDVALRERLSVEVRQILQQTGTTAILVTHDQHEAFAMCDHIAVVHAGRIEQWDTPYGLYHEPATRLVADFIGEGAFLPGQLTEGIDGSHVHVETELGAITRPDRCPHAHHPRRPVDVLLRPDDVLYDPDAPIRAQVVRRAFRGAEFLYTLQLPSGRQVLALVPSHHSHAVGSAIGIRLAAEHVVTFNPGPADRGGVLSGS